MIVKDQGHTYELANLDGGFQTLQFIRKDNADENGKLITMINGTTNEEVFAVLIDRIEFLNGKMYSEYNDEALKGLKSALSALEARTAHRVSNGIEGTDRVN